MKTKNKKVQQRPLLHPLLIGQRLVLLGKRLRGTLQQIKTRYYIKVYFLACLEMDSNHCSGIFSPLLCLLSYPGCLPNYIYTCIIYILPLYTHLYYIYILVLYIYILVLYIYTCIIYIYLYYIYITIIYTFVLYIYTCIIYIYLYY